jgi:RecA/RadA recombinase
MADPERALFSASPPRELGAEDEQAHREADKKIVEADAGKESGEKDGDIEYEATRISDVELLDVDWLWEPYLPLGMLSLMEGDPGIGKTQMALKIAANLSTGWKRLPGQEGPDVSSEPASTIICTAEDSVQHTIGPRLKANGADSSKVFSLGSAIKVKGEGRTLATSDTAVFRRLIEREAKDAKLIILDPIQAYLPSGTDMHRANEVKQALRPLTDFALEKNLCILAIRHLAKGGAAKAIYAGIGSIDFSGTARSVVSVGEVGNQKVMAHVKSSLSPKGESVKFDLKDNAVISEGTTDITAEDVMQGQVVDKEPPQLQEAMEFLEFTLGISRDEINREEIYSQAKAADISVSTLRRAAEKLGVVKDLIRDAEGKVSHSVWYLPTYNA